MLASNSSFDNLRDPSRCKTTWAFWVKMASVGFVLLIFGLILNVLFEGDASTPGEQAAKAGQRDEANLPETYEFQMLFPKKKVPVKVTSYFCAYIEVPPEPGHALELTPVINSEVVHHMILFHAVTDMDREPFECYDMPEGTFAGVIFGWAIGGDPATIPDHMGMKLGKGTSREHSIMQIHYDNPQLKEGLVDNSGFSVLMSRKFRPVDAGVAMLGTFPGPEMMKIPAGQKYHHFADCGPSVTRYLLNGPIKLRLYAFHAHLYGKALWVDLWNSTAVEGPDMRVDEEGILRHGKWEVVVTEPYFDFDYQRIIPMAEPVVIHPGDALRLHCIFDNTEGTDDIRGGYNTQDEMCLVFFIFEPEEAWPVPSYYLDRTNFDERELPDAVVPVRATVHGV